MIAPALGLSEADLEAIADLEQRVVAHDGGRLKLEWGSLRSRSGERVQDFMFHEDGRLVGFLGLYGHSSSIELAGMVDPENRGRGIGRALLDAGIELCRERRHGEVLLIVPRGSDAGRVLARRRSATLDHTEYALLLRGDPADGPSDPSITLRAAQRSDVADLLRLVTAGFGGATADLGERLVEAHARTLMVDRDGRAIGTLRISETDDRRDVYGFVIDPRFQGRGIGRDVLRRVCRQERDRGATLVGLEVEADNDRAIHLYTSLGFEPVTTEDYWAIRP